MTVHELKERLEQFPENCVVTNVAIGCNEADGCVFLDDYEEED